MFTLVRRKDVAIAAGDFQRDIVRSEIHMA